MEGSGTANNKERNQSPASDEGGNEYVFARVLAKEKDPEGVECNDLLIRSAMTPVSSEGQAYKRPAKV